MPPRIGLGSAFQLLALWAAGQISAVQAQEPPLVGFDEIWALANTEANSLKAARHEAKAARIAQARANRHWYPRVSATGRVFSTDNPATTFMSVLGQRRINAADFAPSALNEPGSNTFQQGTLALDLPLYEGGSRASMASAAARGSEAKAWEQKAMSANEFTALARDYAGLLILEEERIQLGTLRNHVSSVIENYEIGSKENPVGYSGLLGLKTLKNRVEGLLAQNAARAAENRSRIQSLAATLPTEWRHQNERPRVFLNRVLPAPAPGVGEVAPAAVKAAQSAADALAEAKGAERARLFPSAGVFAQGDLYGGSRDTATSYSAGAYLSWDLFSAPNFGAAAHAQELAAAAREKAQALHRQLLAQNQAAHSATQALDKNLALLDESAGLLEEQTATARSLFLNGSISALQLVEVLARRADLLNDRTQAELSLASARSALVLTSGASPQLKRDGESHE